jgi:uncharacterized protein (TIGR03083 family)
MTVQTTSPPRTSRLDRRTAMRLAATEYERVGELFAALTPAQWREPTNCPPWDVRLMAGHILGMAEMAASLLEQRRQMREATRRGGVFIDALCALQVEKHTARTPAELRTAWARTSPRAARSRRRIPPFVRGRTVPQEQIINGKGESWTIGYLTETILTRDPWLHRLDIAAATGVEPTHTPDHDALIVDDVVHEWAGRHGQAVRLHLDGPAGGTWEFGSDGDALELDCVEFCRQISGRSSAHGLTETQVPF